MVAADRLPLGGEQQLLLSRWPPRVRAFFVVRCARSSLRQDRPARRSAGSSQQRDSPPRIWWACPLRHDVFFLAEELTFLGLTFHR